MASTGTPTPNIGLNQWQSTDKPERVDFNSDNLKVDSALGNKANANEISRPTPFTIHAHLWVSSTASEYFGYQATLPISGVTTDDRVDIAFDLNSAIEASDAGESGVTVAVMGGVILYAETPPEYDLTGTYVVFRGAN